MTAIEFALLAPPLFLTLTAIFDVAIMFLQDTILESASLSASREIRTGQITAYIDENPDLTADQLQVYFRDRLCGRMRLMPAALCQQRVAVEVFSLSGVRLADPGFSLGASPARQCDQVFDSNGNVAAGFTGSFPGQRINGGETVLVTAMHQYEFITPVLGAIFGDMNNCRNHVFSRLLVSSVVLATEPFQ